MFTSITASIVETFLGFAFEKKIYGGFIVMEFHGYR